MSLGLVVFSNIIYLFISFIINDVILTAFRMILSTWLYNYYSLGLGHIQPSITTNGAIYKWGNLQMGHVQQCMTSTVNSDSHRFNDKITIFARK